MTKPARSIIIGTAGHIDHGKTTLVRALTGIDTDRLPEEKRRGITIDLGFASMGVKAADGSEIRISFVDVPGHILFIRNMLAGAGCVPAVMLVVAADEGIMPQTIEHLAICELLGIAHGMTVITKTDAVGPGLLQEAMQSIERYLQGSFLEKNRAPILSASAVTGEGIEAVRAELLTLALRAQPDRGDALLRMPLDRSFVMKGFGTVVTGSLIAGTINEGQTLQIEPGGRAVRVRGLQTHGQAVHSAAPGTRVAVNLSGVEVAEVRRGQTLLAPGTLLPVDTFDAEVRLLKSAPVLKHRARVHLHAFSSETMASLSLYSYEAVQPGTLRMMRIRLEESIVLVPGDRFVLRLPLPAGTIGGGRVLDVHPVVRARKPATYAWLEQLKLANSAQQVSLRVGRRKARGLSLDAVSAETGMTVDALRRHVAGAVECGDLLLVRGELLLSREGFIEAASAIISRLQPRRAIKASELRSQASLSTEVFDFVMAALVREQRACLRGELVSIEGVASGAGGEKTSQLKAVEQAYEAAGLAAPLVMELAHRLNIEEAEMRRLVTQLQRDKTIVRMGSDDLFIHSTALAKLAAQLAAHRGSLMDVARFKQLTGLSRKYAIPLLEYLDRQRVTRKQGDQRQIL